jgi:GT2 family glycosyltransferase/glycosyltransferase involved in cell wall biosynthesis
MLFRFRSLVLLIITVLFLPLLAAVWLALLVLNLVYSLAGFVRQRAQTDNGSLSGLASIVILNWNGRSLLEEGIPSVIKAVHTDGRPHEIIVVDNGSSDDSIEYLSKNFPEVRVLALRENTGFAEGNNAGVREAKNDVVVLLNNDMIVDPGFLRPLLNGFGPGTFAVSSRIFHQDPSAKREETGKTTAVFRRGMIDYSHLEIEQHPPRSYYPVFWAGGGSSAFHRERFIALGGFKNLFSPAYVEDTDLSYDAWRAGWEVLLAPASIVHHKHRASSNRRFSPSRLQMLVMRNQFLFLWKNIHSWKLLLSHGVYLPWNCYRLARDNGFVAWISFLQAVCAIPAAAAAAMRLAFRTGRTDLQIFERFSKPGLYLRSPRAVDPGAKPRLLWLTAYLPHSGRHAGAGRMHQLLKRLSSKYEITLISFLETDDERRFLPEIESFCKKVIAMRRSRPRRWQLFAYEPFDEFLTPEMKQAVDRCFEDNDIDLIQLEYTQMACYARRVRGIPVLLTKHEVDFAACARRARQERNPGSKLRWYYNYLQVLDREIKLTKNIDAIICMTDSDARELHKFCPPIPTHVINTGVDLEYFTPPEESGAAHRLIFVGAFQHFPNIEAMTYFCREVLPLIRNQAQNLELLIVGSNPPPPILSLASIPGIQVTGYVPDIRPYMASSSIYVVPLRLGVGIRGKILEAWGMGMAVVSTSIGCSGLRYENGRNLLVGDTPEQFASQVLSLMKDPMRRRKLGKEGRITVEQHYSWEKSAQQLDALYTRCIKRNGAHERFASHKPEDMELKAGNL